jgi:hypothetical protein
MSVCTIVDLAKGLCSLVVSVSMTKFDAYDGLHILL